MDRKTKNEEKKNVKQKSNITETGMEWKRFFLEICILDLKRKTEIANCDTYIVKVKFCRKETIWWDQATPFYYKINEKKTCLKVHYFLND